jgi:hypothetical protein
MLVAAHYRHRILATERGDPYIIRRYRSSRLFQFDADARIVARGRDADIENGASVQYAL